MLLAIVIPNIFVFSFKMLNEKLKFQYFLDLHQEENSVITARITLGSQAPNSKEDFP